tara:strand:+ start:180 stop:671 length:492 start_codon:yes stop_codon:yes gene_type:complete
MSNLSNVYNPLFLKNEELKTALELLFFLSKDLDNNLKPILKEVGYNRTHFSVIFLSSKSFSLTIKELLAILNIRKQSLSKVINKLKEDGIILLKQSKKDKRKKNIYLTKKGIKIEKKMNQILLNKISFAYKNAGKESINGFKKILINLMSNKSKKILKNKRNL